MSNMGGSNQHHEIDGHSIRAALPLRAYSDSAGAAAMDDNITRCFERAAYNYLEITAEDEAFRNVEPNIFAAYLYKFALFNSGFRDWESTKETLLDAAQLAKRMRNPEQNPTWLGMFAHARRAPSVEAAKEFLSHSLAHPSIDDPSWDEMPESLKFEGLTYAAKQLRTLPQRLESAESVRAFFPTMHYRLAALLSVSHVYFSNNLNALLASVLGLIQNVDPEFYHCQTTPASGFLFRLVKYRARHAQQESEIRALYDGAWGLATSLPVSRASRLVRYKAMAELYYSRAEAAIAMSDKDWLHIIRKDWQNYLEAAFDKPEEALL